MLIYFVGPLPPPVHGFSNINAAMLCELKQRATVRVFNRAPLPGGALLHVWRALVGLVTFTGRILQDRPHLLYLGLSGGWGQALDAGYLLAARLTGTRTLLHHHSYAYLRSHLRRTGFCFWAAGNASHIVLCQDMGKRLSAQYGIPDGRIHVLSNAAFLPPAGPQCPPNPGDPILGYFSLLSEGKGICRYLDILRLVQASGAKVRGVVAGPMDPAERPRIEAALAAAEGVSYLGPVFGRAKETFLASLTALVFPTQYVNEAEPVVVFEALRAGVPVFAPARSCIGDQLREQALTALPEEGFVEEAVVRLCRLLGNPPQSREAVAAQFNRHREVQRAHLCHLLDTWTSQAKGMT